MRLPVILLALLAAPMVLTSAAATDTPACADVTQSTTSPYGPYLIPVRPQVWALWVEANLVEGLQRVACVDASGDVADADRYMGEYGVEGGGQPVCVPRLPCIWI